MSRYKHGDYVKAEFKDEATSESEWMWVRVDSSDDDKQLVFGRLDSVPVLDYEGKLKLGTELAISYANIRDHKKSTDFQTD